MKITGSILLLAIAMVSCVETNHSTDTNFPQVLESVEKIPGRSAYINSPFVTAGDRLYMVGHQNGSFPDLGWHVTGEMGGIWDHPIKLMDGFIASVAIDDESICLNNASSFINYPFANQHIFNLDQHQLEISRYQFVPDQQEAIAFDYILKNNGKSPVVLKFTLSAMIDLRPVWLGERSNMIDSSDQVVWNEADHTWIASDLDNKWYTKFGSSSKSTTHKSGTVDCWYERKGKGTDASISYDLEIAPGESITVPFTIAGSYQSLEELNKTYQLVSDNRYQLLQEKKQRYDQIANTAKLTIPDKDLQQAYRWIKFNTDWLIRDVPEIGRGIGAGIPDYPWWFGVDSEYTLQGAIAIGNRSLAEDNIALLVKLSESENGNGRIIHEASTNGVVFNPGNINETPQFSSLIWTVYQWTGDQSFLDKYYPIVKKGLEWLLKENDSDKNLLPDGFGMMEIHGMDSEMVDVASYTQKAFADAARMAEIMGDSTNASAYQKVANDLKYIINTEFWVPEHKSYADFIGTREQALHLLEAAITRADTLDKPWAVEELQKTRQQLLKSGDKGKKGYVLHHNWVVNTPMETGIADPEKAKIALATGSQFVNPFGVFVTGIDRDETAGKDESSFGSDRKVFTYTGAVMTLPTGVQAIAENNYGNPDKALDYLQRMTKTFSYALPGSIYEVSPDYGMMTQAWNCYSFAVPVITQFFGIQPNAPSKKIVLRPQMPTSWDAAKLESVVIGDNVISVSYQKSGDELTLQIDQSADWEIIVGQPEGKYSNLTVNDQPAETMSNNGFDEITSKGKLIKVVLR